GTKPELIERLFTASVSAGRPDYSLFERPAHDVVAMVADDAARHGHFTIGIVNCVDVNSADDAEFAGALARGMEQACRAGRFPLVNGETAELSHRVPGPGDCRLNWNSVALALVNSAKEYRAKNLRPGQPVVALRERTIRSNGLTRARAILEQTFLARRGASRSQWFAASLAASSCNSETKAVEDWSAFAARLAEKHPELAEQAIVPWHDEADLRAIAEQLSRPSTIYTPVIHEAQGGVDGPVHIPLVACVHVTGGGVPLKGRRMLADSGLGLAIERVFPDPAGVAELLELAARHARDGRPLVDDRSACEQWNRGVGFACVASDDAAARDLVELASELGFEAAIAGQVLDRPEIQFGAQRWTW
ncbi:MAG TPA: AIR synthase-related protein, partial [Pirellulaceae bacterium]|nr:AIR synthase-related protein [Pirellulaceae bacterium]